MKSSSHDPTATLLLILSVTTGLVDAVSVLGLGGVFTANMTRNLVFLGFAVAGAPGFHWPLYVCALTLFVAGAIVGGRLTPLEERHGRPGWLIRIACLEAGLLWTAASIDLLHPSLLSNFPIIGLTAVAMGLRNATVRYLKVPDLTTTVVTLTLTGVAADSSLAGGANPNLARRLGALASILIGAVVGAVLVMSMRLAVPLTLTGAVVLLATLALAREPTADRPTAGEGAAAPAADAKKEERA
jgi:uncharacterized membrane protein YoaK (UPF0700 family)